MNLWLIAACSLALGGPAEESVVATDEPPAEEAPVALTRIEVGVAKADPALEPSAVDEVLAGHLAGTGLQSTTSLLPAGDLVDHIEWAQQRADPDVAVYVVELRDNGIRSLYLVGPGGEGLWVRELPAADDPDLLLESLGAILRGTSMALGGGPPRGMEIAELPTREPDPPDPDPPDPDPPDPDPDPDPEPPRRKPTPSFGVSYRGGNLERAALWQSGASAFFDLELRSSVFVAATVGILAPAKSDGAPSLEVWRLPVVIDGGYRFRHGRNVRPDVGLGLVLEPLWWSAATSDGAAVRGISGRTGRLGLSPRVGLRWRLVRGLGLHVLGRADLWLLNAVLVVEDGDARTSRFRPHDVGAVFEAGLHYSL